MPDDTSIHSRLSEDAARRVLARAVELDSSDVTVAHLRQAAAEAGIGAEAFEAALAEFRNVSGSRSAAVQSAERASRKIAANIGSLSAAWLTLRLFSGAWSALGFAWTPPPVGFAVGLAFAMRLRARPATPLLAGLAIAQGGESVMDLAMGTHVVHGFGAHAAIAIAGIAGVFLGARLTRKPLQREEATETSTSEQAVNQQASDDTGAERLLTLRVHPI